MQAIKYPNQSRFKAFSFISFFQFGTLLAYALVASTLVGDLLINIRSVYKQDKAISIGFSMTWIAIFVYVPGKILYEFVSREACQYWGNQRTICHLYGEKLGDYLCYLTILFLSLCFLSKLILWFLCKNFQLYEEVENKRNQEENTVLQELIEQSPTTEQQETIQETRNNSKMFFIEIK